MKTTEDQPTATLRVTGEPVPSPDDGMVYMGMEHAGAGLYVPRLVYRAAAEAAALTARLESVWAAASKRRHHED